MNYVVGLLGKGEIGGSIAKICEEAKYKVLTRELSFDEIKDNNIDYLHVNIPEKNRTDFISIVSNTINELRPKLTIINSSVSPGVTREIYNLTKLPIVHSPVIGVHPNLYESIKYHFRKIIGPINQNSLRLAIYHFKMLGLKVEVYDNPETSETAKLIDLVHYAWDIIFCKWVKEMCGDLKLNFDQIYTLHNNIYNEGFKKLKPNVVRPILSPVKGPIGGHCTIPDTIMLNNFYKNRFTEYILKENKRYENE